MLKSYKYKIEPNEEQKVLLNKHFGSIRFAYNYFLNERKVDTRIIHKETRDLLPLDDSEKIKEGTEPIWKTENGRWMLLNQNQHLG